MKLFPPQIPASGRGRCRAAGAVAHVLAQAYPTRIVMRVFSPMLAMALTLALGPV